MRSVPALVLLLTACSGAINPGPSAKTPPESDTPPAGSRTPLAPHALDVRVASWLTELAQLPDPDAEGPDPEEPAAPDLKQYPWAAAARVTPEFCRKVTQWQGSLESCRMEPLAGGSAALLAVVESCGQHSCDVKYWVFAQDRAVWISDTEYGGLELEVSPDHRWLMIGKLVASSPNGEVPELGPLGPMWDYSMETQFIELSTGKASLSLPCSALVLSPRQKYYVCRDAVGNVLRTPVAQPEPRTLELFIRANLNQDQLVKLGGPFNDYPSRVTFPSDTTLEYELYLVSEEVLTRQAPWTE